MEFGIRPLRVVATHREATKPSDREAEFEKGICRFCALLNGAYARPRKLRTRQIADAIYDESIRFRA